MASVFSEEVQIIVGPVLQRFGFVLYGSDDTPDEGGRYQHVVITVQMTARYRFTSRAAKARPIA
jgi:hypothetical protein